VDPCTGRLIHVGRGGAPWFKLEAGHDGLESGGHRLYSEVGHG
jgi:hypothetical protein